MSDNRIISQISDQSEREHLLWNQVFTKLAKLDGVNDNLIDRAALVNLIWQMDLNERIKFESQLDLPLNQVERLLKEADTDDNGFVDKFEFMELIHKKTVHLTEKQQNGIKEYLKVLAYAEEYKWWPAPWFTIFTTIALIAYYFHQILNNMQVNHDYLKPQCSHLTFSPFRRKEVWRFITYMLVHVNLQHLIMNIVLQLLVGLPLEMSHGTKKVLIVYLCGVFSGSLATSVFDQTVFLVGASGGAYALVAAHIATLVINWQDDCIILRQRFDRRPNTGKLQPRFHGSSIRSFRLIFVLFYIIVDTVIAVYRRFNQTCNVSFTAHFAGSIAGLLVGIIVLKNRQVHAWELKLKMFCIISFGIFILCCLFWNVSADDIYQRINNGTFYLEGKDYSPLSCPSTIDKAIDKIIN